MWKNLSNLIKEYQSLELENVLNYEKSQIISFVWHSTKIEGCSLTETETRVLLEEDITAGGKPLTDHIMVKDHFNAFLFIKNEVAKKRKFTPEFVCETNAQVMKNTGGIIRTALGDFDTSKGDLRLVQVYVDKKYFPNYQKIPNLLSAFSEAVDEKINAAEGEELFNLAADAHYNFVSIHPFADGNGRVGRLLMNYILMRQGFPLLKVFTEDRVAYINALNETDEQKDLAIFRKFIGEQYAKFLKLEIEKYRKLNKGFTLMF